MLKRWIAVVLLLVASSVSVQAEDHIPKPVSVEYVNNSLSWQQQGEAYVVVYIAGVLNGPTQEYLLHTMLTTGNYTVAIDRSFLGRNVYIAQVYTIGTTTVVDHYGPYRVGYLQFLPLIDSSIPVVQ